MLLPRVSAVIFEGGQANNFLDEAIFSVRDQVVLDTIEKLISVRQVDEVVLATNRNELALESMKLGAKVDLDDSSKFHFGKRLREIILKYGMENVICMGGAAAPLLRTQEYSEIAATLKRERNLVIMNNVQSADLVAFSPARAIDEIELPATDNSLGNLMRDIGMRRVLIPNSARVNFDLDTPLDILILGLHPLCGVRTKKVIDSLGWDHSKIDAALEVLRSDSSEIAVIGRVGPPVIQYINANMVHRMRVFSEERGMKALGREDKGEVVSLIGFMLEEVGAKNFFKYLSQLAHVVFFDTRVVFGHLKKRLSDWDRFQSDLGRWDLVQDPFLREFTKAAQEAEVPILFGGHSLVAAGLWLMAEMVVEERGFEPTTFAMSKAVRP
jgi:hypothetical protein